MTNLPVTARDFPSIRVKAGEGHVDLTPLRGGVSVDLVLAGLLLAVTALMLLPGALGLPMELWDESRVANNAIEMAKHGGWLVTTFGGVPDHWELKPPLLVWAMAALLRTGMDPMLAIRLPSILATMGSVLLVYASCRMLLKDRLAGLIGGLLLVCSVLFMGDHVGRTGDYDALLCLLTLGFVICAGLYIDRQTIGGQTRGSRLWIAAAAALLLFAFLTKSVASGLTVPGVVAYAMMRGRLVALLADWRAWLSFAGAAAVVAGWFVLRESLAPGYLAAVWHYDIAGTILTVPEGHQRGPAYYAWVLFRGFEPAMLLSATLLVMPGDPDPKRRRLCLLTGLAALSCLTVVSFLNSRYYWYAAPILPLAAVAIGVLDFDLAAGRRFMAEVDCASAGDGRPADPSRAGGVFLVSEHTLADRPQSLFCARSGLVWVLHGAVSRSPRPRWHYRPRPGRALRRGFSLLQSDRAVLHRGG